MDIFTHTNTHRCNFPLDAIHQNYVGQCSSSEGNGRRLHSLNGLQNEQDFFISADKVFSVVFPYVVQETTEGLHFSSKLYAQIDNRATSVVLELLDAPMLLSSEVLEFAEPIVDAAVHDAEIWALFRDLLLSEDGYVRYDFDPDRGNKHIHPVNHLDVFYSSASTFKLGLKNKLDLNSFVDIVNLLSDCHYVVPSED